MNEINTDIDVLAVFSHPDDAELSVAGTLIRLKSLGYRTGVLDMTRGEMGTRGTPEIRKQEAEDAARIMKLDVRLNLEQRDGHVWLTDESRTAMVRTLRTLKPKIVLTHNTDDPHPDHSHTAQIVRESARLSSMRKYDEDENLGAIKVPIVAHTLHSRRVVPTFVVDISDFLEEKMNAIRAHASQFHRADSNEPETRLTDKMFLQQIEWRSHYFGSLIGVRAGEPFYVKEALNIEDPIALLTRSMNIYS